MINFTSVNDSSAKNYTVKVFRSNFSNDFQSKETLLIDEFVGNYKDACVFLEKYKSNASKYNFKNNLNFENDYLYKYFQISNKEYVKFQIRLSHTPQTKIKDMSNTLVASCTTSRAIFRMFTENVNMSNIEITNLTNLSKSDISNIKAGQRHFDLERAAKIASDLGMIEIFTDILNAEYQNMITQLQRFKTQKVFL